MLIQNQCSKLRNLKRNWKTTKFFIMKEVKVVILDFSQGTMKALV